MADSRMIRIGFLDSDRVSALSWRAECFYHRLLLVADDHGLFDARLSVLRTRLFPLCLDKVREADLQRDLAECEGAGLVRLYEVQGKPYLEILNYGQRCQSKPKYPLPSTVSRGDSPCFTVTHSDSPSFTAKTETESEANIRNTVESSSTVVSGQLVPPRALPDAGYAEFVRRVCGLKSAWGRIRVLPVKAEEEARRAYESVSVTGGDFELLAAYYASSMPKDRNGSAFWRPSSLERFLQDFVDVLAHAQRWQKETGWGRKAVQPVRETLGKDEELGDQSSLHDMINAEEGNNNE